MTVSEQITQWGRLHCSFPAVQTLPGVSTLHSGICPLSPAVHSSTSGSDYLCYREMNAWFIAQRVHVGHCRSKRGRGFFLSPVTAPKVEVKQNMKREKIGCCQDKEVKQGKKEWFTQSKVLPVYQCKYLQSVLSKCGCVWMCEDNSCQNFKKKFSTLAGNFFRNSILKQHYETFLLSHHVEHSQMHIYIHLGN